MILLYNIIVDRKLLDDLMQKIQRGDEAAFEVFYNETKRGLFSFILSICKDYHSAEDLMQNTYIRVRVAADSYQAGSNVLAWLFTIAKNITLNDMNKRKREISADFDNPAIRIGGEYTMDENLPGPVISIIKDKLNDSEKQIIALHLMAGFKHREIALMLEKPLGTVLWAYRNALNKIKSELEKEDNQDES